MYILTNKFTFQIHGCVKCFPNRQAKWLDHERTYEDVYTSSMARLERVRLQAPNAILYTYWEHEYDQKYKTDTKFKQFVDSVDIPGPLRMRDAFVGKILHYIAVHYIAYYLGGRVEICKMKASGRGRHIDYCSLYP